METWITRKKRETKTFCRMNELSQLIWYDKGKVLEEKKQKATSNYGNTEFLS